MHLGAQVLSHPSCHNAWDQYLCSLCRQAARRFSAASMQSSVSGEDRLTGHSSRSLVFDFKSLGGRRLMVGAGVGGNAAHLEKREPARLGRRDGVTMATGATQSG